MLRPLALAVPACLALCACSSPPADRLARERGFALEPLRVSALADAAPGDAAESPELIVDGTPRRAAAPQDEVAGGMSERHITAMGGMRFLDDDWDPVEDQVVGGVEFDATNPASGHGYEVGMAYSNNDDRFGDGVPPPDDDIHLSGSVFEIYGGYRHTFRPEGGKLFPYVSAGAALVRAAVEVDAEAGPDQDEDDLTPGIYLRAGLGYNLEDYVRVGIDYRHMFLTDVDIGSISDADYDQFVLTLGFALTSS